MGERLHPVNDVASSRRGLLAAAGAVGAAFLASLCCVGPLLFVAFGVGAGLASTFEPLRPIFTVLTVALMAAGFYIVHGRRSAAPAMTEGDGPVCDVGDRCTVSRHRTRDQVLLWGATALALVFLTFPKWSLFLVR